MNRRTFTAVLAGTAGAFAAAAKTFAAGPWKTSMYQGSLRASDPAVFELAKRIGLDGVELLMGNAKEGLPLRRPDVRARYKEAAKRTGLVVSSLCPNVLNQVPLKSEPKTAVWLLDTIEAAHDFGCRNILVPFFGNGQLKMDDTAEVTRVVDVLKEAGPRAAAAGVTLGLENTLSAEENMVLLEQVNSPGVAVYYDIGNSAGRGRDVAAEIRKLGARICQIHIKDNPSYLGEGKIDLSAVAAAVRDINYTGWLVLETTSPGNDVEQDTRRNLAFMKKTFGMA